MAPSMHLDYSEVKEIRKDLQTYSDARMGKTQMFSKGYSSGFVSDYRHAVDNMAGSEELGVSGRHEAETTASDDSSAPKKRCISLNVDSCDGFGIPVEVFKVSKMSRSERKRLELRLKTELDRVQNLQKKIAIQIANVVPVSSSGDIHSCSEGKKGCFNGNMQRSLEFLSKQGNREVPLGLNSHSLNRGLSGEFESVKQDIPPSIPDSKLMVQCEALLKRLMAHQYAWVFSSPVDIVKLNIPDYFIVIKTPMDLGTVKRKITLGQYSSPLGFLADVRLTFSNAMTYNPPTNDVHIMAKTLSKFFEQRWKNIQKKLPPIHSVPLAAKSNVPRESKARKASSPYKKRNISSRDHEVKDDPVKRVMTAEEKYNLSNDLTLFEGELPPHILDFLKRYSFSESPTAAEDELELDLEVFPVDALFTVRKLLDGWMQEKEKNCAKVVPCELELLNESRLSNSSTQPCKGDDPIDEDVDIGGNDLPLSSYPPVEIEKDTANRNSKGSSSSSSSSDSSSSSSDSETGSSSSSDTDGAKTASPVNGTKETRTNNHYSSQNGNQPLGGLNKLERNPQSNPVSFEGDCRQSEENAPPERQDSQGKSYRAAVLINRFADTIIKAREKTLDQGEKGDSEKLRREREELERQQLEERARLQAEAKAAEEARRQAEAEAAAEAKRKLELDRVAARQALQKMEKTVEMNENCHFLEFEMLRSTSDLHLPLAEVTEHSSDHGLGGFKLQGINPLEQLGLYMKMDDEEEEDEKGESTCVPEPVNDVEEGEID